MKALKQHSFNPLLFVAMAAAMLLACPPRADPEPEEPPVPDPRVEAMEENEEVIVEMTDNRFEPERASVQVGQTVRWRNSSSRIHTVTADPQLAANPQNIELPEGAERFHSGDIAPEEEFTRQLDVPGTYRYVCVPHEMEGMVGTLTVEEQGEGR